MDNIDHNEMTIPTSTSSTGQPDRQSSPDQDTGAVAVTPGAASLNSMATGVRVASEIELGNRASLTSEPSLAELNRVTSSSYFSDDEASGTDVSLGRHKKQKRSSSIDSRKKVRLAASSSSSESLTARKTSSSRTSGSPSMAGNSTSKSARRKARKKEGTREEQWKEFGTPANFSEASS